MMNVKKLLKFYKAPIIPPLVAKQHGFTAFFTFFVCTVFLPFLFPRPGLWGGGVGIGTIGGDILPRGRQNVADFTRRNAAYLPTYRYRLFIVFFDLGLRRGKIKMIKKW